MANKRELPGDDFIKKIQAGKLNPTPIQGEKQPWFWQRWLAPKQKLPDYKPPVVKHKAEPTAKPIVK